MRLRSALPDDIPTLLRHRREMFREMGYDNPAELERMDAGSRKYFEQALAKQSYFGLFLMDGTENIVAGGGIVIADWPGSPMNTIPRRAWILNMYVEPEHRHKGYAQQVLAALIEWCREQQFDTVALHASEYGRSLYEKVGFRPTNEMRLRLF